MHNLFPLFPVGPNLFRFPLNPFALPPDLATNALNSVLDQTTKNDVIVVQQVHENYPPENWLPPLKLLMENRRCHVILDSVYRNHVPDINATFIDYFPLATDYQTKLKQVTTNTSWNPDTNRFLFLTGKPLGKNRALLLKKFMDQGLEKNCIWSFFVNNETYQKTQQILELNDDQFADFVKKYSRSPDDAVAPLASLPSCYESIPYGHAMHAMYEQTSFRVISETQFKNQRCFITEKTWITINNYHPFIMAATPGLLDKLQSMDFQTFQNYQEIPNYHCIEDDSDRLDAIVHNTKTWLGTIGKHKDPINLDILHNKKIYDDLVQKNYLIFSDFCSSINTDVATMVRSGFFSHTVDMQWLLFYNKIKDSSWPDCLQEEDFYKLPEHIKHEIIEVFGFCPKNYTKEN
jgi:hypothetical protein